MSQEVLILIAVSVTIAILMYVFFDMIMGGDRKMKARVKKMRQRMGEEMPELAEQASAFLDDQSKATGFEKALKKMLPSTDALKHRLARAGLSIGLGRFVGFSVAAMFGAGIGLFVFGKMPPLVSVLGGFGIGLGGAHFLIDIIIARRGASFTKVFPDAIDLIVRAVKSGLPVTEGITIVSNEMQGPVAEEFAKISEAMKIGETMEDSLWKAAKRLDNAEFNFFVISLVVQSETGGNLAETLENLSDILRQRQTMKLKVKALASEARASAYILGSLPFVMMAILEILSPGYTEPLFTEDLGLMMSGGALLSISIGALVMFKMVRFEA